jgi:murein DD-endopeptidase MepM/ murein hydrolase activator NlpD
MRKAFLRTPVDFARISSRFNLKRKHPVLNRIRAHKGVDYAAKTGTKIKTTGDGKIIFRGRKGGYGRVVIVQHGQKYSSLYAHMSKFQKNLKVGSRVKQGQTIGYVGKSGLASGPHLHYEFRVNGVHRNPLTVKLPHAEPIKESLLAEFKEQTEPLLAQLNKAKASNLLARTH